MNQSDIIKGLRLQHNAGEPSVQFISNLKGKLMKKLNAKNGFNAQLWGAIVFGVIGIVVLAVVFTSQGKMNTPSPIQGDLKVSTSPTVVPSEKPPVAVKQIYQDVYVKSLKRNIRFNYSENVASESVLRFSTENRDDMVLVTSGGKESLTVGIDWLGWTQGNIPLKNLKKVETPNLGVLYRWKVNLPDMGDSWGYSMSKDIIFNGKCEVYSGFPNNAPCAERDYVTTAMSAKTQFNFNCTVGHEALCDELIKGFEVR